MRKLLATCAVLACLLAPLAANHAARATTFSSPIPQPTTQPNAAPDCEDMPGKPMQQVIDEATETFARLRYYNMGKQTIVTHQLHCEDATGDHLTYYTTPGLYGFYKLDMQRMIRVEWRGPADITYHAGFDWLTQMLPPQAQSLRAACLGGVYATFSIATVLNSPNGQQWKDTGEAICMAVTIMAVSASREYICSTFLIPLMAKAQNNVPEKTLLTNICYYACAFSQ